ncbi:MAG: NAD-dependent epimerase/dehydratase family protein [Planctomycetota bacterium]|nr:NAD-dependent epimerase/dehydratase family protein [Planctomycetota bacterium]
MECLVTGATGFLGRHLVRTLVKRGHRVRALCRSDAPALEREGAQVLRGDVLEPDTLPPAVDCADVVFHLAGQVQHRGSPTALYDLHVGGTRAVLDAAARAKARRVVHVSTSGTIAVSTRPERIAREDAPYATEVVRRWPYYLSKIFAEKVALEPRDVPVVVVSPSLLLGPEDEGLSSSGALLRFLRKEVPAVPPGGLSFVDVRDAAEATANAAERGRPGERYLLGGANMTLEAFFVLLAKVSGVPAPSLRSGAAVNDAAARVLEALEDVTGVETDESVAYAMAGHFWYLDAGKAQAELGFTPRAAEATLRDAVAWLRSRGPLPRAGGLLGSVVGGVRRTIGTR